jgi:hypothetical protein
VTAPREPRDLRPYLEPPFDPADARRHLAGGRRRLARHRRRRVLAGALSVGLAGTAAAALWPRLWPSSHEAAERAQERQERPGGAGSAPQRRPAAAPALDPPELTAGPTFVRLRAHPADALADSIGVHIRLWYAAYDGRHWPIVRRRLGELGVRHLYDVSQTKLDRLHALGTDGFKLHILIRDDGDPDPIAQRLGDALASVQTDWRFGKQWKEGLLDEAWAQRARRFAEDNFTRARRSPRLAHVPIVGPSVRAPYETALVGDLAAYADVGALNYWPDPGPPEGAVLARELAAQRRVFPDRPLAITQSGYNTAPLNLSHVSEAVQARYLLRLHLEAFDQGVVRTFANQLIDFSNDPASADAGLGLLRRDTTPKPSFFALRTLVRTFADPGAAPVDPGTLAVAVETAEPDLRRLLFQRRDGTFVLAVWLARPSQEEPVRRPAVLRLQRPAGRLRALDPQAGETPAVLAAAEQADSLAFDLSDAVTLIELRP